MFTSLAAYKNILSIGAVVIAVSLLLLYVYSLKTRIDDLESKLKDSYVEVANYKLESERLRNSLTAQNNAIEKLKTNKQKLESDLAEWKKKPAKIRYKTISKIREVKSNECKDIKNVINTVRNIDYNNL